MPLNPYVSGKRKYKNGWRATKVGANCADMLKKIDPDAGSGNAGQDHGELYIRAPKTEDGAAMWKVAKKTGNLDLNSSYSYIMVADYFPASSVVAEEDGQIVGFISGFVLPERQDTTFVWQVGVDPDHHGKGIGTRMLTALLERSARKDVQFLETTVTPSNDASMALFGGVARRLSTNLSKTREFGRDLFPGDHEEEVVLRIGPFTSRSFEEGQS